MWSIQTEAICCSALSQAAELVFDIKNSCDTCRINWLSGCAHSPWAYRHRRDTAPRLGIGWQFAQPMGKSQEPRERHKVSRPWSSNVFPSVCDNAMHHALCTHSRKGASLHFRLNYTGLIGFFSSASKTKTLVSRSPPPSPPGPSVRSSHLAFSSQVFSVCDR